MDWKDALSALNISDFPEGEQSQDYSQESEMQSKPKKKLKLNIFYEKKGRAGKPATIITGFPEDDEELLLETARTLKQRMGCGGSARGGEILLQGDRREQARNMLREMGLM